MPLSMQEITLDITKVTTGTQFVSMGQGDARGTTILAHVYDDGAEMDLTDWTAIFCMRIPGGMYYVRDDNCTVSGNTITYVVNEEYCCVVAGETDIVYFELHRGATIASTSRFKVEIKRSASSGRAASSFDQDVTDKVDEFLERMEGTIREVISEMVSDYTLPIATVTRLGGVKPDGTTISVDNDGTIHSLLDGEEYAMSEGVVIDLTPLEDIADADGVHY